MVKHTKRKKKKSLLGQTLFELCTLLVLVLLTVIGGIKKSVEKW